MSGRPEEATPQSALRRLDGHAHELDRLSRALTAVQRELDGVDVDGNNLPDMGVEQQYQEYVDNFEVGLYAKCNAEDGPKWPSEAMREKLARAEMPAELLGRRDGLHRKRDRLSRRIDDLAKVCNAERSILSALKVEAEASGSGSQQPSWSAGQRRAAA